MISVPVSSWKMILSLCTLGFVSGGLINISHSIVPLFAGYLVRAVSGGQVTEAALPNARRFCAGFPRTYPLYQLAHLLYKW